MVLGAEESRGVRDGGDRSPAPSAPCRRISFNATALSPHLTELDADSGLTRSVAGPREDMARPPTTRSQPGQGLAACPPG